MALVSFNNIILHCIDNRKLKKISYCYSYVLSFIHVGGIHKHFVVNLQLLYCHSYTTTYSLVPIFPLPRIIHM